VLLFAGLPGRMLFYQLGGSYAATTGTRGMQTVCDGLDAPGALTPEKRDYQGGALSPDAM
jgi:hypothetical protein